MMRLSLLLTLSASVAAAATSAMAEDVAVPVNPPPTRGHERISDPLEGFNRRMFAVDKKINRIFGRSKVAGSKGVIPQPVRSGLFNFFNNLDEPSNFANDTLQGKVGKAAVSAGRFATNSTIGLLGTFDVATKIGLKRHHEDLGQTLAVYGVKAGPYIYLPLFGPSTVRDKVGDQVDGMARPFGFNAGMVGGQAISTTKKVVQPHVVSVRERARQAADSGQTDDEYATLRELYYQQRAAEIADAPGSERFTSPNTSAPPLTAQGVQQAAATPRQNAPSFSYAEDAPAPGVRRAAVKFEPPGSAYEAPRNWRDGAEQAASDAAFDAANPPVLPPPESVRASRNGPARP